MIRARSASSGRSRPRARRASRLTVGGCHSAVAQIEAEGVSPRRFSLSDLAPDAIEWCDRRLLARIHRRTLDRLRREIEPVSAPISCASSCLAAREARPAAPRREGLARVIEQLEGFEVPRAGSAILPARVGRYEPAGSTSSAVGRGRLGTISSATRARATPAAGSRGRCPSRSSARQETSAGSSSRARAKTGGAVGARARRALPAPGGGASFTDESPRGSAAAHRGGGSPLCSWSRPGS